MKKIERLTDELIHRLKAKETDRKYFDGDGLHVRVLKKNPKHDQPQIYWNLKYKQANGKDTLKSLGKWGLRYPGIGCDEARERAAKFRVNIANSIAPDKLETIRVWHDDTFNLIAKEWIAEYGSKWTQKHREQTESRLLRFVSKHIGHTSIKSISIADINAIVKG
ncbi:MAG TPA: Arm DNA-binding domain-containing protein, partial [Casimicrobiaceae bacterium]|nr:Arm DNA-binding domain-containing protein [Casimicrobiaceae bacterium]